MCVCVRVRWDRCSMLMHWNTESAELVWRRKKRRRQNQIKLMTCLYGLKVRYFLRASVLESSLQYKTDKNKQKIDPLPFVGSTTVLAYTFASPRILAYIFWFAIERLMEMESICYLKSQVHVALYFFFFCWSFSIVTFSHTFLLASDFVLGQQNGGGKHVGFCALVINCCRSVFGRSPHSSPMAISDVTFLRPHELWLIRRPPAIQSSHKLKNSIVVLYFVTFQGRRYTDVKHSQRLIAGWIQYTILVSLCNGEASIKGPRKKNWIPFECVIWQLSNFLRARHHRRS